MCIEHKQYWQCCMLVDSRYIDPCPLSQAGQRCNIEERIHPIGGYCADCRRTRNKLEDDAVTSPLCTRNDDYYPPWNPPKYRPVKSQPLKFPTSSYPYAQPEPERGRSVRRSPSPQVVPGPGKSSQYSYFYTQRPVTPPPSDDEVRYKVISSTKKKHHHYDKPYYDQVYHSTGYSKPKRTDHDPVKYRVASPKTVQRLQRQGLIPSFNQMQPIQSSRRGYK